MDRMQRPQIIAETLEVEAGGSTPPAQTFEEVFETQHPRLYRALYLMVGNRQEAEEIMQDAFLHLLERWDRVEDPAGYLFRCALNGARSRFRRMSVAARRAIQVGPPEDPFAAADLRDEMVRALAALPQRQRAALVLLHFLDYGSDEAGQLLGVTASTVRSLASHGRAALKLTLEDRDDG